VSEYFDGDQLVSPLAGKPDILRYPSYSMDDLSFLTADEQAVVRSCPAGYSSDQRAAVARDVLAACESGPDALAAIVAQIESDTAEENTFSGVAGIAPAPPERPGF
jgi:hypothetical protein